MIWKMMLFALYTSGFAEMALKEKRRRNRECDPLMRLAMKYPNVLIDPDVAPREVPAKMLSISPEQLPKPK
jgi:hypothetical protein